jgi:flagellar L-ring protein precursor FlgH
MEMKRILMTIVLSAAAFTAARADSLYNPQQFQPLAADARAYRVGDNLTISVTEFASMTTNARTNTDKDGSISANVRNPAVSKEWGAGLGQDFTGGGSIQRSGKLVAQLTVIVTNIESNGDLRVKGEQEIEINNEKQRLTVEGYVRPQDIGANNTVPSTRLSGAKISYTGDGLLAEEQKPGVLTRLLGWLRLL